MSTILENRAREALFVASRCRWIGFDLDGTLIRYKSPAVEDIIYRCLVRYLVSKRGYNERLKSVPYDPTFCQKGLLIDKINGAVLKLDGSTKVISACRGLRFLSPSEIEMSYGLTPPNFNGDSNENFASLSTSFEIPMAQLFSLVLHFNSKMNPSDLLKDISDAFTATDGVLAMFFAALCKEPGRFIHKQHHVRQLLFYLKGATASDKSSDVSNNISQSKKSDESEVSMYDLPVCGNSTTYGDTPMGDTPMDDVSSDEGSTPGGPNLPSKRNFQRRLFLLTNSNLQYTSIVMEFAYGPDWRHFFDYICTGARKPSFWSLPSADRGGPPMVHVPTSDGGRLPLVFQGGNGQDLIEKIYLLAPSGHTSEDYIGYIGDSLYSDIISVKERVGWRTIAIVEEFLDVSFGGDGSGVSKWGSFFNASPGTSTYWARMLHQHADAMVPFLESLMTVLPEFV